MFQNWLDPVDPLLMGVDALDPDQLGTQIQLFSKRTRSLRRCRIALLGTDSTSADLTRRAFYQLYWQFDKLSVYDLGNVRNGQADFLIPVLRELLEGGIVPVVFGSSSRLITAQYQAFNELRRVINLAVVDEIISLTTQPKRSPAHYLNAAVYSKRRALFHLSLVGAQYHLLAPTLLRLLEERNYEISRLGRTRDQWNQLEPIIRDADLLCFHLAALKQAEAPAQASHNPSGFTLEEGCQLARYAGLSDKLQAFGVYGFEPTADDRQDMPTAQATAQLLWYFIDGYYHRQQDFPVSTQGLTEYVVDFQTEPLTFWKSNRSGRWWIQAPVPSTTTNQRHRLVPCSYDDYLLACQGQLADRLFAAFKRFE